MAKFIDVSNIIVVEYEEKVGDMSRNLIALINREAISEENAIRLLEAGEYSPHILSMSEGQWKSIFKGKD